MTRLPRKANRSTRAATATMALALAILVVPLSSNGYAEEPESLPLGGSFTDDDRIQEEGFIEAIAAVGVTKGCNPPTNDRFCPGSPVTRAQIASFFVRAFDLPSSSDTPFGDTAGSVHARDISALAAVGITRGCNPPDNTHYCPEQAVTRGEVAAFLARALDLDTPIDTTRFSDDDGSTFEADISRIATAGITSGCEEDKFCPDQPMLRKHMAVFLARALNLSPIPVEPKPWEIGAFTTYYDRCSDPCRVTNIQLISDAVDNAVVLPGETFSVNDHVGQRTEAKGYVPAGAIIHGELYCCDHPANIGGGTSQFATTLYNAVFFAGLEDVYHRPHSIWFSRYPMGREATIGYPGPDVKFMNDTDDPVTINVSYTETSITVSLIGVTDVISVRSIRSGAATTSDGGSVSITRIITFSDRTTATQTWYHTYNPLVPL